MKNNTKIIKYYQKTFHVSDNCHLSLVRSIHILGFSCTMDVFYRMIEQFVY